KHGTQRRRPYRRVHLAMDTTDDDIRAAEFTSSARGDSPATELSSRRDRSPLVIYALRRGLGNHPARGAFMLRSGTGDCGCQMQGKTCWGLVSEGRVRPFGVVVGDPSGDQIARVGDVAKQRLIQELV